MKRVFVIFLFIVTMISYQNVIFASYSNDTFKEELHKEVETLFKERIRVWNQFLIGEYLSIYEIEKELKEFTVYPLLKDDMEMYKEMIFEPRSFEMISKVKVKDISIIKNSSNKVKLEARVLWDVSGYVNDYSEEILYSVELEKVKDKWMLSNYKIN